LETISVSSRSSNICSHSMFVSSCSVLGGVKVRFVYLCLKFRLYMPALHLLALTLILSLPFVFSSPVNPHLKHVGLMLTLTAVVVGRVTHACLLPHRQPRPAMTTTSFLRLNSVPPPPKPHSARFVPAPPPTPNYLAFCTKVSRWATACQANGTEAIRPMLDLGMTKLHRSPTTLTCLAFGAAKLRAFRMAVQAIPGLSIRLQLRNKQAMDASHPNLPRTTSTRFQPPTSTQHEALTQPAGVLARLLGVMCRMEDILTSTTTSNRTRGMVRGHSKSVHWSQFRTLSLG
jgi:hypothetical protein